MDDDREAKAFVLTWNIALVIAIVLSFILQVWAAIIVIIALFVFTNWGFRQVDKSSSNQKNRLNKPMSSLA